MVLVLLGVISAIVTATFFAWLAARHGTPEFGKRGEAVRIEIVAMLFLAAAGWWHLRVHPWLGFALFGMAIEIVGAHCARGRGSLP